MREKKELSSSGLGSNRAALQFAAVTPNWFAICKYCGVSDNLNEIITTNDRSIDLK